ncbi:hypothetical protein ALI144C_06255 [Actinosynnema sp. ALI-1.44]|nr:hypothetical protein ALI144C_06255 [Actinosynnema sp. ALI-1.44]
MLSPRTAAQVEPVVVEEMIAEGLIGNAPDPFGWYSTESLPYGYSLDAPDSETGWAELRILDRASGVVMRCAIGLHIFISDLAGRPALGRMAERVALRTEGWVFVEFHALPSAGLLGHLEKAGRCIRIEDCVHLDAPAMAAWNAHPHFHVVK